MGFPAEHGHGSPGSPNPTRPNQEVLGFSGGRNPPSSKQIARRRIVERNSSSEDRIASRIVREPGDQVIEMTIEDYGASDSAAQGMPAVARRWLADERRLS